MARKTSFAQKAAKASMTFGVKCPKCKEVYVPTKIIISRRTGKNGAWKFNEKIVNICKCNENEYV
ncbi:hypothetical protein DRQ09_08835 [candidate division KSB1 bacterium]|nr:MAG: hypothetical protein DRQ09_08835 [candidate division KSB1 bacterium]